MEPWSFKYFKRNDFVFLCPYVGACLCYYVWIFVTPFPVRCFQQTWTWPYVVGFSEDVFLARFCRPEHDQSQSISLQSGLIQPVGIIGSF